MSFTCYLWGVTKTSFTITHLGLFCRHGCPRVCRYEQHGLTSRGLFISVSLADIHFMFTTDIACLVPGGLATMKKGLIFIQVWLRMKRKMGFTTQTDVILIIFVGV